MDRPVSLYTDVSYSFQDKEGKGTLSVTSQAGSLKARFNPGKLFVGEPNSNWQIVSFDSHRLGLLEFTQAGYYDISLEIAPGKGEEVDFQWLWLGTE